MPFFRKAGEAARGPEIRRRTYSGLGVTAQVTFFLGTAMIFISFAHIIQAAKFGGPALVWQQLWLFLFLLLGGITLTGESITAHFASRSYWAHWGEGQIEVVGAAPAWLKPVPTVGTVQVTHENREWFPALPLGTAVRMYYLWWVHGRGGIFGLPLYPGRSGYAVLLQCFGVHGKEIVCGEYFDVESPAPPPYELFGRFMDLRYIPWDCHIEDLPEEVQETIKKHDEWTPKNADKIVVLMDEYPRRGHHVRGLASNTILHLFQLQHDVVNWRNKYDDSHHQAAATRDILDQELRGSPGGADEEPPADE